jgi:hypothetical protein
MDRAGARRPIFGDLTADYPPVEDEVDHRPRHVGCLEVAHAVQPDLEVIESSEELLLRHGPRHVGAEGIVHGLIEEQIRAHRGGADGVHGDARVCDFQGYGLDEADHSPFGSDVVPKVGGSGSRGTVTLFENCCGVGGFGAVVVVILGLLVFQAAASSSVTSFQIAKRSAIAVGHPVD